MRIAEYIEWYILYIPACLEPVEIGEMKCFDDIARILNTKHS